MSYDLHIRNALKWAREVAAENFRFQLSRLAMAAASVKADHEEVNKLLCCAVCIEQFKEPKVLPCLHTFCKECLVKLVKKKGRDRIITCPECRQDTKIIDGDVGKLQPNFWVNNFMTLLRVQDNTNSSAGKPMICELCDSDESAVSSCTNCCVFMCKFCVTAHKRINATKDHQILSLEEVRKLGGKALVEPTFCKKHGGESLKLFCQTCQKTICRDCAIGDHREHKYEFVADVAKKERKAVQAILNETRAKERTVAEGLEAVKMMKIRILSKVSEVNELVDSFFDEQAKSLEHHRAKLKHEATTQGQLKVNQIESQTEMLSLLLAQLKSGIDFTDRAIGDDVKLLSMKKQLIQQLGQLNSSQNQLTPCKDDFLKLQVHQPIQDIGTFATIRYIPCDPQKCTVSMVGGEEGVMYQTIAGQSVDFMLVVKDDEGCRVTGGGNKIRVQVFQNDQQFTQTPAVHDHGDGLYSFCFCPAVVGIATLKVEVEGQNVCGSPFNWKVNPENIIPVRKWMRRIFINTDKKSALRKGMHSISWKLQLVSFSPEQKKELGSRAKELNIGAKSYIYNIDGNAKLDVKWSWSYNRSKSPCCQRSDGQRASITSVQDRDVFTVFLNLETKKLIIYNVRSKQAELFKGVDGDFMFPVIFPMRGFKQCDYEENHLSLAIQ